MINYQDPELLDLTFDAALKAYWRKQAFRAFLRNCGVSESFVATWSAEETKRDFLDRTFAQLRAHKQGGAIFRKMAIHLSERTEFPDLANWDDSEHKLRNAKAAVEKLKICLSKKETDQKSEQQKTDARMRASEIRKEVSKREHSLQSFESRLTDLSKKVGTQIAGYDFQTWFYDLVDFNEIDSRKPYIANGRQIDGSITVQGTTYLIELKFTKEQASATDVDSLFRKVETKADNTMGILVSISGFSGVAITEASKAKTVLLLLDYNHLFMALRGVLTLREIVERVRRNAAQTCQAYLPVAEFEG